MTDTVKKKPADKEDKLAKEIGQRLVQARTGLGLSQQTVHGRSKLHDPEGMGVSRAVLSLYETGVNKPGAREINLLCKTLTITPNWLLFGSESPQKTLQPSLVFLQGDDLTISVRLSLALMTLLPEDRDTISSLIFSLLNKSQGDIKLSSLMTMANYLRDDVFKAMLESTGKKANEVSLQELISFYTQQATDGFYTNWGTLRPAVPEDEIEDFDFDNPPSPRDLKK